MLNMSGITAFLLVAVVLLSGNVFGAHPKYQISRKIVQRINANTSLTWQADTYGENKINLDHFIRQRLGQRLDKSIEDYAEEIKNAKLVELPAADTLPTNFTWADLKNCSIAHIRDQSSCGSCWAFATTDAFRDRLCIQSKGKIRKSISANYMTACDKKNYGCAGGNLDYSHRFLVNGVITGGDYESRDGCQMYTIAPIGTNTTKLTATDKNSVALKCYGKKCNNNWYPYKIESKKFTYRAKSYKRSPQSEYEIRKEIYENGPVTAGFVVHADFMYYKKGIYTPTDENYLGMHAIRIIGWGEENDVKYWHIANSWGSAWGENGLFRMLRGVNCCWIEYNVNSAMPDI